jgi:protein SCO1/2
MTGRGARAHRVVVLAVLGVLWAHGAGHGHEAEPGAPHPRRAEQVAVTVPDVEVVDQDGRRLGFYTDLVRDRVVAINFVYTTCTTSCPLLGVAFRSVQDLLGVRIGREAFLLSVSVDPATDTPARLKAWAARYGARPGWTLVTGVRPEILRLLRALGVSAERNVDHPTFVLVGDDRRGRWSRAWGLVPGPELAQLIERAVGPAAARPVAGDRR